MVARWAHNPKVAGSSPALATKGNVFGSILTSRFNDNSDVDFSVVFHYDQIPDLFLTFFDFIDELRHLLGREVDLVDETAIKNDIFRKELNNTKRLIYG